MNFTMSRELLDFLSVVGGIVGFATILVFARVKGWASIKGLEEIKASFAEQNARLKEVVDSQVSIRLEQGRLSEKVSGMSDLVGQLMDRVGEYVSHTEDEEHRLQDRVRTLENEGCAYGRARLQVSKPGNGQSED